MRSATVFIVTRVNCVKNSSKRVDSADPVQSLLQSRRRYAHPFGRAAPNARPDGRSSWPTANALVGLIVPPRPRGTVYGSTTSAMFLSNPIGPLPGGAVGAAFGVRWVFVVIRRSRWRIGCGYITEVANYIYRKRLSSDNGVEER